MCLCLRSGASEVLPIESKKSSRAESFFIIVTPERISEDKKVDIEKRLLSAVKKGLAKLLPANLNVKRWENVSQIKINFSTGVCDIIRPGQHQLHRRISGSEIAQLEHPEAKNLDVKLQQVADNMLQIVPAAEMYFSSSSQSLELIVSKEKSLSVEDTGDEIDILDFFPHNDRSTATDIALIAPSLHSLEILTTSPPAVQFLKDSGQWDEVLKIKALVSPSSARLALSTAEDSASSSSSTSHTETFR